MDDHTMCPLDESEQTLTFTPSFADEYEGDLPELEEPEPPKRPYIPGYDFEMPDDG